MRALLGTRPREGRGANPGPAHPALGAEGTLGLAEGCSSRWRLFSGSEEICLHRTSTPPKPSSTWHPRSSLLRYKLRFFSMNELMCSWEGGEWRRCEAKVVLVCVQSPPAYWCFEVTGASTLTIKEKVLMSQGDLKRKELKISQKCLLLVQVEAGKWL